MHGQQNIKIYRVKSLVVPQFDCSIYEAVFTDFCSLSPGPNFTIMIIAAQVARFFNLSPIYFYAHSPVIKLLLPPC